jgi:hypothetical protein
MKDDLFNTVLTNINRIAAKHGHPPIIPGRIIPQKRQTSKQMDFRDAHEVKLLVGPIPATPKYTRAGNLAKRQPTPHKKGDILYAKLNFDGNVNIYPFAMAGSGYEIIKDAIEGTHYEFI